MLLLVLSLNLNGYTLYQYNYTYSYTFGDVEIQPGQYVVVARNSNQADFEAFWGVSLGSNVIFINSGGSMPVINGDETYSLYDAGGTRIDTTYFELAEDLSYYREATNTNTWLSRSADEADPGSGANGGFGAGLVITEVSDALGAGNYIYEFIELYYDEGDPPPYFRDWGRVPSTPGPGEQVIVKVRILDNSAIAEDSLFYSFNGGSYISCLHDSINIDTFYFTIPAGDIGDQIGYFCYALDDSGNSSYSDTIFYTIGDTTGYRILFDFTKDEDAGNADWIIDRDYPEPYPPDPVAEDDWDGAISSWGFELKQAGWTVMTLPPESTIKYGTSSPVDLSNFDVFVIPEPQDPFSSTEKKAIFDFVRNGGGLFMVADHNASDRNNNGWDSPRVFNDLGILDSFGMHLDTTGEPYNSVSDTFTWIPDPNDPIIQNNFGVARGISFHLGDVAYLEPAYNSSVKGVILYTTGYAVVASCTFGNGRVVLIGDTSPCDDGTGDPGDVLYDGWNEYDDRIVFLNATLWLATGGTGIKEENASKNKEVLLVGRKFALPLDIPEGFVIYDATGRPVRKLKEYKEGEEILLPSRGIYIMKTGSGKVRRLIVF